MNGAIKPRVKSSPSSSGTRPKIAAGVTSSAKLDDEFNAFFDEGDAGDYDGASGSAPASIEPVTYDERQSSRAPASKERRALLAKVVASVVAGCAAVLVIAVGLKFVPARGPRTTVASNVAAGEVVKLSHAAQVPPELVKQSEQRSPAVAASDAVASPVRGGASEAATRAEPVPTLRTRSAPADEPTGSQGLERTEKTNIERIAQPPMHGANKKRMVVASRPLGSVTSKTPAKATASAPSPAKPSVAAFPVE
jgi:hypothetical protein